jgi:hypothetical protein
MAETTESFAGKKYSKWVFKCFSNWKTYTAIRKNITETVTSFQEKHANSQVRESYLRWRDAFVQNSRLKKKADIGFNYYRSTHLGTFFKSWKEHINERKMEALSEALNENHLIKKTWEGLKLNLYKRMYF